MSENAPARERVEARLRAGDRRFKQLKARIDASDQQVKEHLSQQDEHLRRQDEKIDVLVAAVEKIQTNTQSMVDTWDGGARVVRTMCRLAEAWRFAVRHVALPAMGVGTVGLIVVRYMRHEPIPDWAAAVVKVLIG